jgi:ketosteroid isomerase-like protein
MDTKAESPMTPNQLANRLVSLCRAGQYEQAQHELYAADAASVEMPAMAGGPIGNVQGLAAILEKGKRWMDNVVEIHGGAVSEPLVAGNWFAIAMSIDATYKDRGRVPMQEICVYRVRDGKIVQEQFFYDA